jgi:hypothetical protein
VCMMLWTTTNGLLTSRFPTSWWITSPSSSIFGFLHDVVPTPSSEDTIFWTPTTSGHYTTSSAYKAQFFGSIPCAFMNII